MCEERAQVLGTESTEEPGLGTLDLTVILCAQRSSSTGRADRSQRCLGPRGWAQRRCSPGDGRSKPGLTPWVGGGESSSPPRDGEMPAVLIPDYSSD